MSIKPTPQTAARRKEPAEPDVVDRIIELMVAGRPDLLEHSVVIAAAIRRERGGERVYIKRGTQAQREAIAEQVRAAWTGRNAAELARLLGIGRTTVYRMLRRPVRE